MASPSPPVETQSYECEDDSKPKLADTVLPGSLVQHVVLQAPPAQPRRPNVPVSEGEA